MNLLDEISNFKAFNEQEEVDKEQFLTFMDVFDCVLTRENFFGHFSASAFVVNEEKNKMLVVYHIINDGWIYPGGHADGECDLLAVAVREVKEETGLDVKVLDKNIYAIQSLPVKGHIKHGKYVSAHNHYDVVYIMEADDKLPLEFREDESKGVKWIPFEQAGSDEMCDFIRPIHEKLVRKLRKDI